MTVQTRGADAGSPTPGGRTGAHPAATASGLLTGLPGPFPMANTVRTYDWGSRTALATLQGRAPSGAPEAELWMGAHAAAPSALIQPSGSAVSLADAVAADPVRILGPDCADRFGARLPFLLKVLAVDRALSIQVHPSPAQAAIGFAREEAAAVPPSERSFVDPYAKPEMLVPVGDFTGLAGLRPGDHVLRFLAALDLPALEAVVAALRTESGPRVSAGALATLATWPQEDRAALAEAMVRRARALVEDLPAWAGEEESVALSWVLRLADQHPGDPLVVAPLLLRLHHLPPGAALYLPAGVPHAYLSGTGVEIMAASDNVVRGGLTAKHIDGQSLIEIIDPAAAPLMLTPVDLGAGERLWQAPSPDFALSIIDVQGGHTVVRGPDRPAGPQVLFCLRGEITVSVSRRSVRLRGGGSVFVAADDAPIELAGTGEVFRATVGGPPRG